MIHKISIPIGETDSIRQITDTVANFPSPGVILEDPIMVSGNIEFPLLTETLTKEQAAYLKALGGTATPY